MAVAWQFWVFFAAMHPLLKPAIWIGEVLHSSPGPSIEFQGGDFMPWSFVAGNVAVIGALAFSKRLSGFVNVALLGLFINFVGLGLEGALRHGEYHPNPTPIPTPDPDPNQARSTTVSTTSHSMTASRAAPPTSR